MYTRLACAQASPGRRGFCGDSLGWSTCFINQVLRMWLPPRHRVPVACEGSEDTGDVSWGVAVGLCLSGEL